MPGRSSSSVSASSALDQHGAVVAADLAGDAAHGAGETSVRLLPRWPRPKAAPVWTADRSRSGTRNWTRSGASLDEAQNRRSQLNQGATVQVSGPKRRRRTARARGCSRTCSASSASRAADCCTWALSGGQVRLRRRVLGGDLLLLLLGEQTLVVELHRPLVVGLRRPTSSAAARSRFASATPSWAARPPGAGSLPSTVRDHGEHRAGGDVLADTGRHVDQEPPKPGGEMSETSPTSSPRVGGAHREVSAPRGDGAHRHCLRHRCVTRLAAGTRLRPRIRMRTRLPRRAREPRRASPAICGRLIRRRRLVSAPFLRFVKHGHEFVVLFRLVVPPSRGLRASGAGVALAIRHGAEHVLEAVGEDRVENG